MTGPSALGPPTGTDGRAEPGAEGGSTRAAPAPTGAHPPAAARALLPPARPACGLPRFCSFNTPSRGLASRGLDAPGFPFSETDPCGRGRWHHRSRNPRVPQLPGLVPVSAPLDGSVMPLVSLQYSLTTDFTVICL